MIKRHALQSAFIVLSSFLCACSSITTVDEIRRTTETLDTTEGDTLVLLGRSDAGHYETDLNFVNCVSDRLKNIENLEVIPGAEFVDSLFPWFEPRTAPKSLPRLQRLLEEPLVANKIKELNVRYMVWMDGHTENAEKTGSMSCSAGAGGAGCFGFLSWNRVSFYEAMVWNIHDMKEEGRVRVDSEGTNYVIGAVVPIPLLTQSKGDACKGMGNQLRSFFDQDT